MLKKFCMLLVATAIVSVAGAADKYRIKVAFDKANAIYTKGDSINLAIQYLCNNKPASAPIKVLVRSQDGTEKIHILDKPQNFTMKAEQSPYAYQFVISALTPDKKEVQIGHDKRKVYLTIGCVVDPQDYRPGFTEPADFDQFWDKIKADLAKIPVKELERKEIALNNSMLKNAPNYFAFRIPPPMPSPAALEGKFKCWDVKVACDGAPVSGYLTMPADAAPKTLPAIVSFHGAPGGSARMAFADGVIRFDVNPHGFENGHPREYYKNKFATTHRAYQYRNAGNRDRFYFRGMFMRVKRALDYVKTIPEYDGRTLIVVGNSQGGAQSLVAAGLDSDVKLVYASVPALCDHGGVLVNRRAGWPRLIPVKKGKPTRPDMVAALPYYDAAFFAKRIKAEAYLTTGLMDTTCSPTSVLCAYNNIPGKKHITIMPSHTHSRTYSLEFNKRLLEVIKAAGNSGK